MGASSSAGLVSAAAAVAVSLGPVIFSEASARGCRSGSKDTQVLEISRCKAIEKGPINSHQLKALTESARTAPRARCSRLPGQNGRSRVLREHASGRPSVRRVCGPERHGWVGCWRAILGALRGTGPCRPHSNDSHSRWGIHAHRRFTEGQSRNARRAKAGERC